MLLLFGTFPPKIRVVAEATADFPANRTTVKLVTAGLDDLNQAIADLVEAIGTAVSLKPAPSPWIDDTVTALKTTKTYLDSLGTATTASLVLARAVSEFGTELSEQAALARAHASCAIQDWFRNFVGPVSDKADALLKLCTAALRESDPELRYLTAFASGLFCTTPEYRFESRGGCGTKYGTDCDRAAALVGLTPVLPWLRREPSRPPRKAIDLPSTVDELFHPSSDVHPKLLIEADPRLGANLHHAWANEQIAPPPQLSGLQVLRIRAVAGVRPPGAPTDPAGTTTIWLDAVYDGIAGDSWVVVESPDGQQSAAQVTRVQLDTVDVHVPGKSEAVGHKQVTKITVNKVVSPVPGEGTVVWARGEALTAVGDPIATDVQGAEIELARVYDGLRPGRWLVVSGERTDVPHTSGVQAAEVTMVAGIRQRVEPDRYGSRVRTFLSLAPELSYRYRRDTVTVYGNVVEADQGETRTEVLGSGDPGVANQVFPLRQANADNPLTFRPSANASGAESTLVARVSGVRWHETEGLVWSGPTDHDYEVSAAAGTRTLRFGDGVHGARVPAGVENVTAVYRIGAGPAGNVAAGQINQATGRPPGVRAVTNPLASGGGADGDGPADVRASIPLRMLALDRLVSVRDYEDFTRARAGIGKAKAVKLSDGGRRVVHVTVAATGDARIDSSSGSVVALEEALAAFGDRGVQVRVAVRERVLLVLHAGIKVLPDYSWELVEPAVRAALLDEFSFARRELGEPAFLSEAYAAIQAVPGVDYAAITVFDGIGGDVTPIELATVADRLTEAKPCVGASGARFEEVFDEVGYVDGFDTDTLTTIALRHGLTVNELVRLNPGLDSTELAKGEKVTVYRGIRPARLAVLPAGVPEALLLVRIP
ncbi:predicted protein [Streptomyces sp. AA4]|nr:predicted protein [Streptomyces sp. AA4]